MKTAHTIKAVDAATGEHLGTVGFSRSAAVIAGGTVYLTPRWALKAYRP